MIDAKRDPKLDGKLERLVMQHARTSRLMGVDFVPAYRSSDAAGPGTAHLVASEDAAPAPVDTQAAPPARETPTRTPPRPTPPAAPSPAPAARAPLFPQPAPTIRPAIRIEIPKLGPRPRDPHRVLAALAALRARYEADAPHRNFVTKFNNIVFGEGDPCAELVFVGEAPGEEEDKTGRPFVGRAGGLLDKMIIAMGLSRERVYICNVLKTRPIDNATPTLAETEACKPYLLAQLAIIRPRVIVTLGKPAAACLLESQETMTNMRGNWRSLELPYDGPDGGTIDVMPTYHPAYLLRAYTDDNRRKVWNDLRLAMERLTTQA